MRGGFALVGMGCQLTVVLPDKQLIFVINSDARGNESGYDRVYLRIWRGRKNNNKYPLAPAKGYCCIIQRIFYIFLDKDDKRRGYYLIPCTPALRRIAVSFSSGV